MRTRVRENKGDGRDILASERNKRFRSSGSLKNFQSGRSRQTRNGVRQVWFHEIYSVAEVGHFSSGAGVVAPGIKHSKHCDTFHRSAAHPPIHTLRCNPGTPTPPILIIASQTTRARSFNADKNSRNVARRWSKIWRAASSNRRELFCPKLQKLSQFLNVTVVKHERMISLLPLNNFYPDRWYHTDEFKTKRKRRIIVYDSVARYGPQTSCQSKGVEERILLKHDLSEFGFCWCSH